MLPVYTKWMTRRDIGILIGASLPAMAQKPDSFMQLPANLPVPLDDGACDHLAGMKVPSIALQSTKGRMVNLAEPSSERVIVYAYPLPGRLAPRCHLIGTKFLVRAAALHSLAPCAIITRT
jgi:hypothetical protein